MKHLNSKTALAVTFLLPLLSGIARGQTEITGIESDAAPAVAQFNATTYVAFTGLHPQPENLGHRLWYTTVGGTPTGFDFYTTMPPALVAARGTVYLAARGNAVSGSDSIYYSSLKGTALLAPSAKIPGALTTAGPALAGDSSTLFAAWTTATGVVEYASYTGSWSAPQTTPAVTNIGSHPALAVFNSHLYVSWLAPGTDTIMYAALSLDGGGWSAAASVGTGITSKAPPTLAVFNAVLSTNAGLYVGWTTGSDINAWKYDTVTNVWAPGPIPPGPLTTNYAPALLSSSAACTPGLVGTIYNFEVFYTHGSDGNVFFERLLNAGKCYAPPPPCKPFTCH